METKTNIRMPGEYEEHEGCIMIWPVRPGSWIYEGKDAQKTFLEIANVIAQSEHLYLLAHEPYITDAKKHIATLPNANNISVLDIASNDSWARDVAPTFIVDELKHVYGINWKFNAWGGSYDGLYKDYEEDDKLAKLFLNKLNYEIVDHTPFILEGGAIHSDGEGTILTTDACLLSGGRNINLSKEQIEDKLKEYLGASKVIWLPHGIYQDETNEHVDNVCAFTKPGTVVLAVTDDVNDPQYEFSRQALEVLQNERDAKGRKIEVIKLPIPKVPVCITKYEAAGYQYEEGEDEREIGERLAASYVNFYLSNHHVLVPQFDDENDVKACEILQAAFPTRKVAKIPARSIIIGGGNIHCITQQIPKGDKSWEK